MALISMMLSLVVFLLNSALSVAHSNSAVQEINLLILVPDRAPELPSIFQPSYDEGPALYLAAELAAKMVNKNSSLLQGYQLNLLRENSGCNLRFRAVESFAKPLSESILGHVRPIVGVIGPTCSLSALSVSALSGRSEVALINIPLAGTHLLQDRTKHPYSFSMLDSSRLIASALVSLTMSANWTKVALFYDTSRLYYSSVIEMIGEEANQSPDYLEPVGISGTDFSPILSIWNDFRVIFLVVGVDLLSRIMCIAHENDYSYPTYQYILHVEVIEAVSSVNFEIQSRAYNCSRNQIRKMLHGSILINREVERPDSNFVTASGISLQAFKEMYNKTVDLFNQHSDDDSVFIQPSLYGALFYDAVWSFVLALDAAMNNTDLASYGFGQWNVTNLIREKLWSGDFEGLSGRIRFNEETGHVEQNAQFFLIKEVGIDEIADYSKENGNISFCDASVRDVFIRDRFDETILTIPKPLAYFTLVVILFGFILTVVLNILTCAYRNMDSVKASSTKLSQAASIGCYIQAVSMLFAVLIYGFTDKISEGSVCKIQALLDFSLSFGLTVLLGAICVRIWRLHRIFNRYKDPGRLLSDQYLILSIVGLVVINLALTVPAFFVNRYRPVREEARSNNIITTIVTCKRSSSNGFFLWFIASLLVSAVLLSVIFILAVQTRKIPQKNFKTKSIMYLSYMLTSAIPLLIGIYFIFSSLSGYISMVLRFCTLCLLLLSLILIPCVMLFVPPLLLMLKRKHHGSFHSHS